MIQYNKLIINGTKKGQSIHHIMSANPDVFQKCEKTIYEYFHKNRLALSAFDMPRMHIRRTKTNGPIRHKVDRKCREGRTMEDYHKYREEHPDLVTVEMDSVIGAIGGKVLLTLQFDCGMLLAYLRDTNNSQSVLDYFDWIEAKIGIIAFRKLFPIILTDNGSEFSNPKAIETSKNSGENRTKVFYCDSYSSWQKGSVENNHLNLRRILPKKTSFDNLNQHDINLVLCHLNSYIRNGFDDIPALERFTAIYGKDLTDIFELHLINPNDVMLNPTLLRGKIKE